MKGYLTWRDTPFAKTHALVQLVEQAKCHDENFIDYLSYAEDLSPFAWRFRYPGDLLDPSFEETEKALVSAGELVDFTMGCLPEEYRP